MRVVNFKPWAGRPFWSRARLAQPAERKALNLVVVGSSPTVGVVSMCPGHAIPAAALSMRACGSGAVPETPGTTI